MDAADTADHQEHGHDHHHEMPTEGRALTGVAVSATLHCLTGCAIGEVSGMAIGTAAGFSDLGTIALAVGLAFLFGYTLTSLPLLRAGFTLGAVIPIALAADTLSIATMEVVDNVVMVVIPGAMDAGLGSILFWGALSFALAVAFVLTVPVNRYLIARGKGHCAIHETGIHGGPPIPVVGAATAIAAIFGASVLIAELISDDGDGGHGEMASAQHSNPMEEHTMSATKTDLPGLSESDRGLTLELESTELPLDESVPLRFKITESNRPVTKFEVEHERRMHLIVVRRDLTGFQHLHPELDADGTWSTPITLAEAGKYRVFADFSHDGRGLTLGSDLRVAGDELSRPLPDPSATARSAGGYEVALSHDEPSAAGDAELSFTVTRDGGPVEVEPYLGADGHLVALREGDLAYLHVHPVDDGAGETIRFRAEFPTTGAYRLFLQFKHAGEVHTAAFTKEVIR